MAFFAKTSVRWTTILLCLVSATGLDPSSLFSIPGQSIDLLASLGLYNSSWAGVTIIEGSPKLRPAYLLQGDYRDLKLPPSSYKQITELLRSNLEYTISVRLKQEPNNTGTIFSFAHGFNKYLELQSSGRKDEIRFYYTSRLDSNVHVETFHYRLDDNEWHSVAISISGAQVDLLIDCETRYRRILKPGMIEGNFSEPMLHLWVGQRNSHYYFKGAMQNFKVIAGPHGYLPSCPHLDMTCPTCGQFSLLQNTVSELTRHLQELSERLVQAEKRISTVEECDCQKSCQVNGSVYADGATWQSGCDLCSCVHGEVKCNPVTCPEVSCKHPVYKSGDCCQSCLKKCYFHRQFYDHGEIVTVKKCTDCTCNDGSMKCVKTDPEKNCPKLTCPPEKQFSVPDECCKFCPGIDYCAKGHFCHNNATCLNLQTTYACQCDQGFQGDGKTCTDIDECQKEGDLGGHHCRQNTRCLNTVGSYICECLPGHRRIDKFNCAELDECSAGEHNCDVNALCVNTQGSYHCVCKEGYTGDGYACQPVCGQSCLNGGTCISPGKCACRNGYTGSSCERDLDECAANLHRCTETSECVNMIGWYYCKCKEGYHNPFITDTYSDNNLGTKCLDINECDTDLHTCHPSAQCKNTDGGFTCACPPNRPNCNLSCVYEEREMPDGSWVSSKKDQCQNCSCDRGVVRCEKPKCDCSLPGNKNECCPRCNESYKCRHQELENVILSHGEQWSYQCETCECLYGEIDCEAMKCPPLLCDNPVKNPEDCCPHCEDPCSSGNESALGQPCVFAGHMYESGSQFIDPNDPCTACNCKDGMLCCSYHYGDDCGDDPRPVGYDGMVAATAPPPSSPSPPSGAPSSPSSAVGAGSRAAHLGDSSKTTRSVVRMADPSAGLDVDDGEAKAKTEQKGG